MTFVILVLTAWAVLALLDGAIWVAYFFGRLALLAVGIALLMWGVTSLRQRCRRASA